MKVYDKLTIILAIMGVAVIVLSVSAPINIPTTETPNYEFSENEKAYIPHGTIRINSDSEFAQIAQQEGWPGDGSENDPYIIEGYEIDAQGEGNCIYIGNTTVHFIIRNCYLHNASWQSSPYFVGAGITLYNVINGIIENNTCSGNDDGIFLYSSSNNTIINNTCSDISNYGIYLDYSSNNNTVFKNFCNHNYKGIFLYCSNNNIISNNTVNDSDDYAIDLISSNNNTISENNCSNGDSGGIALWSYSSNNIITNNTCNDCGGYGGIYLHSSSNNAISGNNCSNNYNGIYIDDSSNNNIIVDNVFYNNTNYGVVIGSAEHNKIYRNFFYYNHGSGDTFNSSHIQACDYGSNNYWNSSSGVGNYWHDWANNNDTNDQNNDDIVDWPYPIEGSAGAKDYYPLKNPTIVPEFLSFNWIVVLLAIFAIVYLRTRKKNFPESL